MAYLDYRKLTAFPAWNFALTFTCTDMFTLEIFWFIKCSKMDMWLTTGYLLVSWCKKPDLLALKLSSVPGCVTVNVIEVDGVVSMDGKPRWIRILPSLFGKPLFHFYLSDLRVVVNTEIVPKDGSEMCCILLDKMTPEKVIKLMI